MTLGNPAGVNTYDRLKQAYGLEGRENVPSKGGALLVPNHVSRVDAVLLIASPAAPARPAAHPHYGLVHSEHRRSPKRINGTQEANVQSLAVMFGKPSLE